MSRLIRLDFEKRILAEMTDEQLITETNKLPNGEYATDICRTCGAYFVGTPNTGISVKAIIRKHCPQCFYQD